MSDEILQSKVNALLQFELQKLYLNRITKQQTNQKAQKVRAPSLTEQRYIYRFIIENKALSVKQIVEQLKAYFNNEISEETIMLCVEQRNILKQIIYKIEKENIKDKQTKQNNTRNEEFDQNNLIHPACIDEMTIGMYCLLHENKYNHKYNIEPWMNNSVNQFNPFIKYKEIGTKTVCEAGTQTVCYEHKQITDQNLIEDIYKQQNEQ
ncbi:Hypothetical_protein [Hexamita inflata]|uniref:Hypothetical_protein n=1 Tax=Hexamita inflata TaxID=28002 RepID=A0AA86UF54_9EUKA|nr:Hypothetical protein HINF_LOCUS37111 [Hexamita inflata]